MMEMSDIIYWIIIIAFIYSLFDIKKQLKELKELKKNSADYHTQQTIVNNEIGLIIVGVIAITIELFRWLF